MQLLREIRLSFIFYWRTLQFFDRHTLWRLLIFPAILNLILAIGIAILAWNSSDLLVNWINENYIVKKSNSGIHSFLEGLLLLGIRGSVVFLYLKIFRYGVLILLSPLLAYISGQIQSIDSSVARDAGIKTYVTDCTRGMRIACINFIMEIAITFLILVFSLLITWLFPIAPLFILIVESYFFGYSMSDYRNEFHGLTRSESRELINEHVGLVIGNGLFFNFCLLIPLIGVLFTPVFSLVAAGLSFNYVEKRKSILCQSDQSTLLMAKP
jgi:CysZ protein